MQVFCSTFKTGGTKFFPIISSFNREYEIKLGSLFVFGIYEVGNLHTIWQRIK